MVWDSYLLSKAPRHCTGWIFQLMATWSLRLRLTQQLVEVFAEVLAATKVKIACSLDMLTKRKIVSYSFVTLGI